MLGLIQLPADLALVKLFAFWVIIMGLSVLLPRELLSDYITHKRNTFQILDDFASKEQIAQEL